MASELAFAQEHGLPQALTQGTQAFDDWMNLGGISYRKVARRETLKVQIAGRSYFIKKHFGVGWAEILKNWLTLKRPVISAQNEVDAIHVLTQLGIATTPYVAHGRQGCSPAQMRSFVLTQDLGEIVTLEDLTIAWKAHRPHLRYKRALIQRVAEIARTMHENAIYHRDFYICHFCLKRQDLTQIPPLLHVLDLHRAVIHKQSNHQLQKKDLSALYFSAMDAGLSRGDKLHFLKHYLRLQDKALQNKVLINASAFYAAIDKRAQALYQKYQRKMRAGIKM